MHVNVFITTPLNEKSTDIILHFPVQQCCVISPPTNFMATLTTDFSCNEGKKTRWSGND